ncbi:hypothetical protein TSOC_002985, partial [Tetrabaena socialis]
VGRSVELPGAFGDDPDLYATATLVYYALEDKPLVCCRFAELFEPPPEPDPAAAEMGLLDMLEGDGMPGSIGSVADMVAGIGGRVVDRVVGSLGNLVGNNTGGGGGGSAYGGRGQQPQPGNNGVMGMFKNPMKLFRGGAKESVPEEEEA